MMLTKGESYFEKMAHNWSNDKKNLIMVMNMLRYEDKQLKVEAILQFSLFLLRPHREQKILTIMINNREYLIELLSNVEVDDSDTSLKTVL